MKVFCKRCGEKTSHKYDICIDCKRDLVRLARDIEFINNHPQMISEYCEDGYDINKTRRNNE